MAVAIGRRDAFVSRTVSPNVNRTILAEKTVIVEGSKKTGFIRHILSYGFAVLFVPVYVLNEDGTLVYTGVELGEVVVISGRTRRSAGIAACSVELVVNPLVPRVARFVATTYGPAVATYYLLVYRDEGIAVSQIFMSRCAL